jgi:hypothetical protein
MRQGGRAGRTRRSSSRFRIHGEDGANDHKRRANETAIWVIRTTPSDRNLSSDLNNAISWQVVEIGDVSGVALHERK